MVRATLPAVVKGLRHDRKSGSALRFSLLCLAESLVPARPARDTRARGRPRSTLRPTLTPLPDAVIVTSDGVITAVGSRSEVQIPDRCARDRLHRQDHRCRLLEQPRAFHASRLEERRHRAGRAADRAHAGDADTMGFYNAYGISVPIRATRCRCAAGSMPAKSRAPISSLPATSSPRAAIPPICRPRCNCPKPARLRKPRKLARTYLGMGLDGVKLFTGPSRAKTSPS